MPALFVEGADSANKTVTDILILTENGIDNIMESAAPTNETMRDLAIYSSDINKDGYMEVPLPRELNSQSDAKHYAIDWVAYEMTGERYDVFTTYHNRSDGWYFILPKEWMEHLASGVTTPFQRADDYLLARGQGERRLDGLPPHLHPLGGQQIQTGHD